MTTERPDAIDFAAAQQAATIREREPWPRSSPVVIQTMLHIYCVCEPLRDTPAVRDSLFGLTRDGLIRDDDERASSYRCTELGLGWITMLLSTPFPIVAFLDPRDGKPVPKTSQEIAVGTPTTLTDASVKWSELADDF